MIACSLKGVEFHYAASNEPFGISRNIAGPNVSNDSHTVQSECCVNTIVRGTLRIDKEASKLHYPPVGLSDVFIGCNVTVTLGDGSQLLGVAFPDSAVPLTLALGSGLVWQQAQIRTANHRHFTANHDTTTVVTCHGVMDSMIIEYPEGGMFNRSWHDIISCTGWLIEQIWPGSVPKTVLNARVFAVGISFYDQIKRLQIISNCLQDAPKYQKCLEYMSLAQVNTCCSPIQFMEHRKNLLHEAIKGAIQTARDECVGVKKPLLYLSYQDGELLQKEVFAQLHQEAIDDAAREEGIYRVSWKY